MTVLPAQVFTGGKTVRDHVTHRPVSTFLYFLPSTSSPGQQQTFSQVHPCLVTDTWPRTSVEPCRSNLLILIRSGRCLCIDSGHCVIMYLSCSTGTRFGTQVLVWISFLDFLFFIGQFWKKCPMKTLPLKVMSIRIYNCTFESTNGQIKQKKDL